MIRNGPGGVCLPIPTYDSMTRTETGKVPLLPTTAFVLHLHTTQGVQVLTSTSGGKNLSLPQLCYSQKMEK